jgi:hypothetical protein
VRCHTPTISHQIIFGMKKKIPEKIQNAFCILFLTQNILLHIKENAKYVEFSLIIENIYQPLKA